MSNKVLQVTGLKKSLQSSSHRFDLVVPHISLERGQFYGLVGKSGSGKSTMLDILALVSLPTSVVAFSLYGTDGPVDIARLLAKGDDKRISHVRLNSFGYILQSGGLFEFLTVRQNLELPKKMTGFEIGPRETQDLAALFEMDQHIDKYPSELSGGQRQRVSILRALSLAPPIVLADEPTASVDEMMADIIVNELRTLAKERGSTVLMVSHDTELINSHSDHVLLLKPELVGDAHTRSELASRALV